MLPTTLFRLAVASFATFTLLPAQSAPVARVQPHALGVHHLHRVLREHGRQVVRRPRV